MIPNHLIRILILTAILASGFGLRSSVGLPKLDPSSLRMREVLSRATSAFQTGDYQNAITLFDALETYFGREPELANPTVQRVLLPARAYSEFATGNYEKAEEYFKKFLEQFPEPGPTHAFVLYTLAQTYQLDGDLAGAADRFGEFVATYPGDPETSLAAQQRIELLFQTGETEKAFALIESLYSSGASETLRNQVQLRALQERVDAREFTKAADILLSTPWQITRMPELAVLTFGALQTGDALLQAENASDALRAYRFVPPFTTLLERQLEQLELAKRTLAYRQRQSSTLMASAWTNYYSSLIQRLESQLATLEAMGDYTPGFLLRFGQAFLTDGRGREARIVFRNLALDESIPSDVRQQAHYRWILAEFSLDKWEETLQVAVEFEEKYPDSELAPQALYLVAQAHQEQQHFRRAIYAYNELLERFPDHPLAPRWLFTRGFNLSMLEQYEDGRIDFSAFYEKYPDHPLVARARFWHALTHHFEENYDQAIAELVPLAENSRDNVLYPEIRYRIATAYYALQDYDTARELIEEFLAQHPGHQRGPEAVVLRGDILMGQGELIDASAAFASVTPEAGGLFPYAIFQRGKIFKALERYDLMVEHFTDYLDRDDLESLPRMSEALYWLGWAYLQEGQPAEALTRFDEAISQYGDDPSAAEIQPLLSSLEAMRGELLRGDLENIPDHPVLNAPNFSSWLDDQIDLALAEDRLTWFSRLKLFQANQLRARGDELMARTILQEIDEKVPMDRLDPEVVGQIGLIYSDAGYDYADDYFDYILTNYPQHPARAEAFFGSAQAFFKEEKLEEADDMLRKFNQQIALHPLVPRVNILRGRVLTQLGHFDDAEKTFEDVLRLKEARGEPHARALAGLAEMNEARGDFERAIPYWQRIYTLYRAYPDRVAEAYYRSALLFNDLNDTTAAIRSLEEMLADESLLNSPYAVRANQLLSELSGSSDPSAGSPAPIPNPESQPGGSS